MDRLKERAQVADYLIIPTAHSFPKTVRLYSLVYSFVSKLCQNRRIVVQLLKNSKLTFQMFNTFTFKDTEPGTWLYGEMPYSSLPSDPSLGYWWITDGTVGLDPMPSPRRREATQVS